MTLSKLTNIFFNKICTLFTWLYIILLLFLIAGFFLATTDQIIKFVETGSWVSLSFNEFLNKILTLDPHIVYHAFSFDYPNPKGLENIANWFFHSNASLSLFLLSLIWFFIGLVILYVLLKICDWTYNYSEARKNLSDKISIMDIKTRKSKGDNKIKIITVGFASAWVIGVLAVSLGVIGLFNGHLSALLLLLIALVVLPPLNNLYERVFKFRFTRPLKIIMVAILLILFSMLSH